MLVKTLKLLGFAALAVLVLADPAFATSSGNTLFKAPISKAAETFESTRTIIFIVGGFGLVGLAFAAIFGKIHWKWFAALGVGLFVLAIAGSIIDYATDNQGTGTKIGDSGEAGFGS